MVIIIYLCAFLVIGWIVFMLFRKKTPFTQPGLEVEQKLLLQHVVFYQELNAAEKKRFEASLRLFLQQVRVTGVNTAIDDMDAVLVAASAIIPIFAFKNWSYTNIHEVLIYPGSFDGDFHLQGKGRNTLGMVGNGPMQNVMILSRQDLRNGFLNATGKSNTGIHEFVHLVDKSDGDTDGLPEVLLQHQYAIPWMKRMHQEIGKMKSGKSDINPYATTNDAEFLAVTAEYFFKQPQLMAEKHPELFALLQQVFTPG